MKRIIILISSIIISVIFLLTLSFTITNAQVGVGKSCNSNGDCDPNLLCMQNNSCGRYCEATGAACEQILDSYCNVANGLEPESRGSNNNCTCECVDVSDAWNTCNTDSDCPDGYWCVLRSTEKKCRKIVQSFPPCSTAIGENGACSPGAYCVPSWIKTASPPCPAEFSLNICCVDPQTPPRGNQGCGMACSTDNECIAGLNCDPLIRRCYGTPTNGSESCPKCTGTSGKTGVCLDHNLCENLGYNSDDGDCTSPYGTACCTDQPTGNTCTINPIPPYYRNAFFSVDLNSSVPNIDYLITTNPATCLAGGTIKVDGNGYAQFTSVCQDTGTYTITAKSTQTECSATFDVTSGPNPYDSCTGHFTKMQGECHYLYSCPLTTFWDGMNPPYPDTGCAVLDSCCVYENDATTRLPMEIGCVSNGQPGINTALGCIQVNETSSFLRFVITWALGVASGTAFILMIVAGFILMTSSGNPQRTKAGKDLLTAAITGLLMIIFAVFILDVIGIRLLKIPGL